MAIIAAAAIGAAATIYGASQSAKASQQASQAQSEAAALQTQVARELHQHWKDYYRQCDIDKITEVCATPLYVPKYTETAGRTRLEILRSFARARDQARKCADAYCVGSAAQQCNFISGIEAIALADSVNFGYRYEENTKITRDQIRLENIYRWLGLGRNLLSQSNAASQAASAAAARLGAQAGMASNGWLQAAGYLLSDRGQTLANKIFDRFSSGSASGFSAGITNPYAQAEDTQAMVQTPSYATAFGSAAGATTPAETGEAVSGNYSFPSESGTTWGTSAGINEATQDFTI